MGGIPYTGVLRKIVSTVTFAYGIKAPNVRGGGVVSLYPRRPACDFPIAICVEKTQKRGSFRLPSVDMKCHFAKIPSISRFKAPLSDFTAFQVSLYTTRHLKTLLRCFNALKRDWLPRLVKLPAIQAGFVWLRDVDKRMEQPGFAVPIVIVPHQRENYPHSGGAFALPWIAQAHKAHPFIICAKDVMHPNTLPLIRAISRHSVTGVGNKREKVIPIIHIRHMKMYVEAAEK